MSEVVKYEPKKPVQSVGILKSLLASARTQIADALPKHLDADRMIKLALIATQKNPALLRCTQESILMAMMTSAELGVDISGTLGEAYLIPYGQTCQFILGYKGMAKLARQSGDVSRLEAEVVYRNDHFRQMKGTTPILEFAPCTDGERGNPVGAYALVQYVSGGIETDYMSVTEIEKVRAVSKAGRSGPWVDWWDEMAKKTVMRRLLKTSPMSSDKWSRVIQADNDGHTFKQAGPTQEVADLNERLSLSDPTEDVDPDGGAEDAA